MEIAAHFENPGPDADVRRDFRRTLLLAATGATSAGNAAVTIHNISVTGLLLQTEASLVQGESIDVELPHAGKTRARVVWSSGRFHGCAFVAPISHAALSAAQLQGAPHADRAEPVQPVAIEGENAAATPVLAEETLGERIVALRKQQGLTLTELARRLAVSKPTVWAWEQGKARPIDSRLPALAEALGVQISELQATAVDTGTDAVLARARRQIAAAYRTSENRVRIMIEL